MKFSQSFIHFLRFTYSKRPALKRHQRLFFIMRDKILQQYKTRDKLFLYEYVNLYVLQVEYRNTENSKTNSRKNSMDFICY